VGICGINPATRIGIIDLVRCVPGPGTEVNRHEFTGFIRPSTYFADWIGAAFDGIFEAE